LSAVQAAYHVGQVVSLRADPARQGPIIEVIAGPSGRPRYRVFHSATEIREYGEDQIVVIETPKGARNLLAAMRSGSWLDPRTFAARLSAHRIASPLLDNVYALHAARIQFIPFQFKPLLRLLRADRPRILVADEVGVGKTIEAGLILKELETRGRLDSAIIVCPKALVHKWRTEMKRFDEDFAVLDGKTLRYCIDETHRDGVWPVLYARAIVHLELLRMEDYTDDKTGRRPTPGLFTLDPPPAFSVVVVDEAHHLRTPATRSFNVAKFLSDVAETVVFLSATPVQLGAQNLFALLHLLRPDLYQDEASFREMLAPNAALTRAMRHIRSKSPEGDWGRQALNALQVAEATAWGSRVLPKNPRFATWRQRLAEVQPISDGERVRCLRDLEEVHTLAHIVNRTRRRDIGRFTIREPHTITVPFTAHQQALYDALIAFRRDVLTLRHGARVARLVIDTIERQAASCLPALLPAIRSLVSAGKLDLGSLGDDIDLEVEEGDPSEIPGNLLARADQLASLCESLPPEDPKLDRLSEIVSATLSGPGSGKVLVFSFFLHTLRYLERHLAARGHRVAIVAGWVPDEDRERLRDRFRLPREHTDALDVLLSSEVGCEGLDYEFCDRLVNYDIPWNPMRVEQRIGRIDRFGQGSEKVLVFNFVTPGTVEERIFFRCFERLGIFRDTLGDLEEVLGEAKLVESLAQLAQDTSLTPDQADAKAHQLTDNVLRVAEEQRRLEEEGRDLLGLDDTFLQDIATLEASGRTVSAADLRALVGSFVEQPELGGKVSPDPQQDGVYRIRLNKEARKILHDHLRVLKPATRQRAELLRWLDGAEPSLAVVFTQDAAIRHRQLPFITPAHPLAKLATNHWLNATEPLAASLQVNSDRLPAGRFLFMCEMWEVIALRPETRLVTRAIDLSTRQPAPAAAQALVGLISEALSVALPATPPADEDWRLLETQAEKELEGELARLGKENEVLVSQHLAALEAYYPARLARLADEAAAQKDPRIVRMKQAELRRLGSEFEERKVEVESRRRADIVSQRVAAGVLEVANG